MQCGASEVVPFIGVRVRTIIHTWYQGTPFLEVHNLLICGGHCGSFLNVSNMQYCLSRGILLLVRDWTGRKMFSCIMCVKVILYYRNLL